jgi:NADH dehydrogenase
LPQNNGQNNNNLAVSNPKETLSPPIVKVWKNSRDYLVIS